MDKAFDLKQCASCKELKKRAKDGQTKSGPVWVDESNRKWHGKTCPDCYAVKNRSRHKNKHTGSSLEEFMKEDGGDE